MSPATRKTRVARTLLSFLLWATLPAGLIGLIQLGTQIHNINARPTASFPCTLSGLRFYNGSDDQRITATEQQGTLTLSSNSTLYQQVCQPGMLRMLVRGTPAEGIDPQLTVVLGTTTLLTMAPTAERPVELMVDHPGLLTITFGNDQNRPDLTPPEDRNVFIRELQFTPVP